MANVNLYKKIGLVMESIHAIQRDKKIEGGKASYQVTTEGQVLQKIRPLLLQHKLALIPVKMNMNQVGSISLVMGEYKLIDLESGEFETIGSVGGGFDASDKGPGKAMTYCGKYALLKTFLVETTNDDPDNFSSDDNVKQEKLQAAKAGAEMVGSAKTNAELAAVVGEMARKGIIDQATSAQIVAGVMKISSEEEFLSARNYISSLVR